MDLQMKVEIFCKLTGKLAHSGCLQVIEKQVPKNKIFEICDCNSKSRNKREIQQIISKIKNKDKKEDGTHNHTEALKENGSIKKKFPISHDEIAKVVYRAKKSLEKRIVKEYFPPNQSKLFNEMGNLILNGSVWNKATRRILQRKCNLYDSSGLKLLDSPETKECWIWLNRYIFKGMNEVEKDQIIQLNKNQISSNRTIHYVKPKPFDFVWQQVLSLQKKETIIDGIKVEEGLLDSREIQVLRHRFSLTGCGTKSLRYVSNLLGISHTAVRNIEIRALKKLKAYLKNHKPEIIKESTGQEISLKEYKAKFGHPPSGVKKYRKEILQIEKEMKEERKKASTHISKLRPPE